MGARLFYGLLGGPLLLLILVTAIALPLFAAIRVAAWWREVVARRTVPQATDEAVRVAEQAVAGRVPELVPQQRERTR